MILAQNSDDIEAIMKFSGETDSEMLDSYEVERLADLLERPVAINIANSSKLKSCGLFSRYQIASLTDYRQRHGDVLSFSELSALDGFGDDFVDRVAPFVSLYSPRLPGERADTSLSSFSDLAIRTGLKLDAPDVRQWNAGLKYRADIGECMSASFALSRSASASDLRPDAWSGSLSWSPLNFPVRIVLGDFNARFGQGLALWNGMTMSGLSSPSSFLRSSSGISQSWSFTGSSAFTGMASEVSFRHVTVSAILALPEIKSGLSDHSGLSMLPAVNLLWCRKKGQMGLTHYAEFSGVMSLQDVRIPDMKTSADISFCFNGVDVSSEVVYDWVNRSAAALGAVRFAAGEDLRLAAMLRFYPPSFAADRSGAARSGTKCSNEMAATVAGQFSAGDWVKIKGAEGFGSSVRRHSCTFSVDAAYFPVPRKGAELSTQLKAVASWEMMLSDSFRIRMRLSERLRSWDRPFRTDLRVDLSWISSSLELNARINALQCVRIGVLSYVEGGYRNGKAAIYLRAGVFSVNHWDDRIYVYERDAPGNFNVPAFYGKGAWCSATASWRFARWGRVYLRLSKKPGKAELKCQGVFSF